MATNFLDLILGTPSLVEGQEKERRLCCQWLGTELIATLKCFHLWTHVDMYICISLLSALIILADS
jgi:hypothetical protein